jgi:RNA polymerase sigma factor (sigma-70 family)
MREEDRKLLQKSREGHQESYLRLAERYAGVSRAVAYTLLMDSERAEEVAAQALAEVFFLLSKIPDDNLFPAALRRVAKELCRTAAPPASTPKEKTREEIMRAVNTDDRIRTGLRNAVAGLPEDVREIFFLKYLESKPYAEIAALMEISEEEVAERLALAREELNKKMRAL